LRKKKKKIKPQRNGGNSGDGRNPISEPNKMQSMGNEEEEESGRRQKKSRHDEKSFSWIWPPREILVKSTWKLKKIRGEGKFSAEAYRSERISRVAEIAAGIRGTWVQRGEGILSELGCVEQRKYRQPRGHGKTAGREVTTYTYQKKGTKDQATEKSGKGGTSLKGAFAR